MNRVLIVCLLVFGLSYAVEDNVGSETTDIGTKAPSSNINFRFFDKNKRGAVKITNTDSPNFNHLSSSNVGASSASSSGGFKPSTATANVPPFRYIYNQQQYYQPNPFLTYVQLPQAAQIAAQYSFQANPVAHFLQTPNQIQYVAAPTAAQVPQIKYQTFSKEYSSANSASDSVPAAVGSQYVSQTQQTAVTPSDAYVSAASSGSAVSSNSQSKQVQVPLYQGYQATQPFYYTQQPLLIFPQSQAANFIYQQPNVNYLNLIKQQQLASAYGGNRLGLYTPTQNAQLTYLVPMVVSQPEQDSTSATSGLKSSDKTVSSTQQAASSNSFAFGTKA